MPAQILAAFKIGGSWRCACSGGECHSIGAPGKQHGSDEHTNGHTGTGRPL
jgi:hypothetical protein